jgi:molybdopterin-guanine dinucleotide biosynthesis protein A
MTETLVAGTPPLNGLVLCGGYSRRMGIDKGGISFHGKEQRLHLADLLRPFCSEVFLSCRADQKIKTNSEYPVIEDVYVEAGPYGGILSAFQHDPGRAWLVIACDLPLLSHAGLALLVAGRRLGAIATAFRSPEDDLPEPLAAIWERASYPVLLAGLEKGYRSPRKILSEQLVQLITPANPQELMNVNTPCDLKLVEYILGNRAADREQ